MGSCREDCEYGPDEIFFFALAERLPTSATLLVGMTKFLHSNEDFFSSSSILFVIHSSHLRYVSSTFPWRHRHKNWTKKQNVAKHALSFSMNVENRKITIQCQIFSTNLSPILLTLSLMLLMITIQNHNNQHIQWLSKICHIKRLPSQISYPTDLSLHLFCLCRFFYSPSSRLRWACPTHRA